MQRDKKEIIIKSNIKELSQSLSQVWIQLSKQAIKDKGTFVVALSGGITPIPIYKNISLNSDIIWNKTHIFLVDERFVPLDHLDSNYRMIEESLLRRIKIPAENIHPVKIKDTAKDSALEYEKEIRHFFNSDSGQFPEFDLIVLGLGQDGHIASLFPKNKVLSERKKIVVDTFIPEIKHERISFSLPVINNAKNIIFLVAGKNKASTIKDILFDQDSKLPASLIDNKATSITFLIDKGAGSLLKNGKER